MILICLIFLFTTSQALSLVSSSCDTAICQVNLMKYVISLKTKIKCAQDNNNIYCSFTHSIPPKENISGLKVVAYFITEGIKTTRYLINDFTKQETKEDVNMNVVFGLENIRGKECTKVGVSSTYINYQCMLALYYINEPQDMGIKIYAFRLTLRVPRILDGIVIAAGPVLEDGCDCVIMPDLNYTAKIYKEDCVEEINPGTKLLYGDRICLKVDGNDVITKAADFTVTSITMQYKTPEGTKGSIELVDLATIECEEGKVYANFEVFGTGTLEFSMVIVIGNTQRSLSTSIEAIGMRAGFPNTIEAEDPFNYADYTPQGKTLL